MTGDGINLVPQDVLVPTVAMFFAAGYERLYVFLKNVITWYRIELLAVTIISYCKKHFMYICFRTSSCYELSRYL